MEPEHWAEEAIVQCKAGKQDGKRNQIVFTPKNPPSQQAKEMLLPAAGSFSNHTYYTIRSWGKKSRNSKGKITEPQEIL